MSAKFGVCCGALVVLALAGCSSSGQPVAEGDSGGASNSVPAAPESTAAAQPTGPAVGTATMKVLGGSAPVTIRYRINGGPETTETSVTLPWSKDYPVYNEVSSSVSVIGGEVTCTIMMGSNLVSYKTETNPTCEFAYYG